jgi:hypothetical protein
MLMLVTCEGTMRSRVARTQGPIGRRRNTAGSPANMAVFRIGNDGKLSSGRQDDVEVGKAFMWWMGMVQV